MGESKKTRGQLIEEIKRLSKCVSASMTELTTGKLAVMRNDGTEIRIIFPA